MSCRRFPLKEVYYDRDAAVLQLEAMRRYGKARELMAYECDGHYHLGRPTLNDKIRALGGGDE
jgi:hypothetical protein